MPRSTTRGTAGFRSPGHPLWHGWHNPRREYRFHHGAVIGLQSTPSGRRTGPGHGFPPGPAAPGGSTKPPPRQQEGGRLLARSSEIPACWVLPARSPPQGRFLGPEGPGSSWEKATLTCRSFASADASTQQDPAAENAADGQTQTNEGTERKLHVRFRLHSFSQYVTCGQPAPHESTYSNRHPRLRRCKTTTIHPLESMDATLQVVHPSQAPQSPGNPQQRSRGFLGG